MPTVPINITGASYLSRSRPLSAQKTINFYPEIVEDGQSKSRYVLHSFPGTSEFGSSQGNDRGMAEHLGTLYKVTGSTLYSVNSSGTHTSLGTIAGTAICTIVGIGTNIVIANGAGVLYQWNGSTLSTISDVDLESPNFAAHLNNQMIYDGDNGRFCTSDVGDATSVASANYAAAESNADDLRRPYVFGDYAYMMGDKTIEPWLNSGVGNPPFDPVQGGVIPVGLLANYSVAHNDNYMYFLGDDNEVYRVTGVNAQKVTNTALSRTISGFTTADDAIGWCTSMEGKNWYWLTFPAEDKSFIYDENGYWFQVSSGISEGRHRANSYAYAFRKHLVADSSNGKIYELSLSTFTDNSEVIRRVRDTGPIHGGLFNAPGQWVEMNRFELIMETGVGITSGQGSDPVVMLQVSDDGGKTFSNELWGKVGQMGQSRFKVEWHALGGFYERIIRIATSDPVFYSIHAAAADIELGI